MTIVISHGGAHKQILRCHAKFLARVFEMAELAAPFRDLADNRMMPLGPGMPHEAVRERLQALTPRDLFGQIAVTNIDAATACLSGLWLLHDFLAESHSLSQDLGTAEGSWWHGIMHRREPDYGNSKYWFRRVGKHPVLAQLVAKSPAVGYEFTSFERFVDFCEKTHGTVSADEEVAKRVQSLEWQLLFAHCCQLADS